MVDTTPEPKGSPVFIKPELIKKKSIIDLARGFSIKDSDAAKELFQLMDANRDGSITVDELELVVKELGVSADRSEVETLFKQLDLDDNGAISLQEFIQGLGKLNEARKASKKLTIHTDITRVEILEKENADLKEKNELFIRYFKENVVERILRKAQDESNANLYDVTRALLEVLDIPRIEKFEVYTGPLLTDESKKQYEALKQVVIAKLKR